MTDSSKIIEAVETLRDGSLQPQLDEGHHQLLVPTEAAAHQDYEKLMAIIDTVGSMWYYVLASIKSPKKPEQNSFQGTLTLAVVNYFLIFLPAAQRWSTGTVGFLFLPTLSFPASLNSVTRF